MKVWLVWVEDNTGESGIAFPEFDVESAWDSEEDAIRDADDLQKMYDKECTAKRAFVRTADWGPMMKMSDFKSPSS